MPENAQQAAEAPYIRHLSIKRFRGIEALSWFPDKGMNVLLGGGDVGKSPAGRLEPTVLLDPPAEARISREEVFGPVLALYRYQNLDDAIARANALPTAFQASVFAGDIDVALRAADRLDASAVMVNDPTTFRTDWMPFAGRRTSGYGTGGIGYTLRDMTQEKMVVLRRG